MKKGPAKNDGANNRQRDAEMRQNWPWTPAARQPKTSFEDLEAEMKRLLGRKQPPAPDFEASMRRFLSQ